MEPIAGNMNAGVLRDLRNTQSQEAFAMGKARGESGASSTRSSVELLRKQKEDSLRLFTAMMTHQTPDSKVDPAAMLTAVSNLTATDAILSNTEYLLDIKNVLELLSGQALLGKSAIVPGSAVNVDGSGGEFYYTVDESRGKAATVQIMLKDSNGREVYSTEITDVPSGKVKGYQLPSDMPKGAYKLGVLAFSKDRSYLPSQTYVASVVQEAWGSGMIKTQDGRSLSIHEVLGMQQGAADGELVRRAENAYRDGMRQQHQGEGGGAKLAPEMDKSMVA